MPSFPSDWGLPPLDQTKDIVRLPGNYGYGSSTLRKWILSNLQDAPSFNPQFKDPRPTSPYPSSFGPPPRTQTKDIVTLPGGYGQGSSTLANWITSNLPKPAKSTTRFPSSWGAPPTNQSRDLVTLPGGYGQGSGTLAKWITNNQNASKPSPGVQFKDGAQAGVASTPTVTANVSAPTPVKDKGSPAPKPTSKIGVKFKAMTGLDGIIYGPGGNMPNVLSRRSNELAHKVAENLSNALSEARNVAASRTRIFNSGMEQALERIKSMIDPNRLLPHMLEGIVEFESDIRNPNAVENEDVAYDSDDYDTDGEFLDDFRWMTSEGQMEMERSLLQLARRQAQLMNAIVNKLRMDFNESGNQMRVYLSVTSSPDNTSGSLPFGHEMDTSVLIFFSTLISKYLSSLQSMKDDIRKMGGLLNTSRQTMISFLAGMDALYKSRNNNEKFEMATDTFFRDLNTDNYQTDRSDPRSIIARKGGFADKVLHGEKLYDFGKSALVELILLFHPMNRIQHGLGQVFVRLIAFEKMLNRHLAQIAMLLTYKEYA